MHRFITLLAVASVSVFTVACGGKSNTAPTPTVSSVTITSTTDMLKVKESVTFTANATHSDGSTAPVTQWSSDALHIATVDATSGSVTGVGPGNVTIMADHDGMRGTKLIRVVPAFQGRWDGDYSITGCSESGNFTGFCKDFSVDRTLPTTLQFTQNRDSVDGNFSLGQLTGAAHGIVSLGGNLSLSDFDISNNGFKVTINMASLTIDSNDRMQGTFRAIWTHPSLSGQGRFDAKMRIVVRTSAVMAPAAFRPFAARTWQDLASAAAMK